MAVIKNENKIEYDSFFDFESELSNMKPSNSQYNDFYGEDERVARDKPVVMEKNKIENNTENSYVQMESQAPAVMMQAEPKNNNNFHLNIDSKHVPDTIHIDITEPHLAILYYVNDSDGDTIIYENMLDLDDDSQWVKYKDDSDDFIVPAPHLLVEKKRITPKQGRVVAFDGLYFHTAMQPRISKKRIIINCNAIALL